MKSFFGQSKRIWLFRATLVSVGLGCTILQAADRDAGQSIFQTPVFFAGCGAFMTLAVVLGWMGARKWRANVLRRRAETASRLKMPEQKPAPQPPPEQQELALRQERLAAVGELAAGLAHEFNNILTVIQGHAYFLLDNPNLDEESIKSVNHITGSVDRAASLVKQMLAFGSKQVMQQRIIHIRKTMDEVADMLGGLVGAHIAVRFEIAPALPPIMADPQMLQQIIVNLTVNARDVMKEGGHLTIGATEANFAEQELKGVQGRRAGRFVALTVNDTGPGIEAAVLKRLFEPFFTTKDIGKGVGLGLATVHGMVKQNGGWIEVESTLGIGTSFHIYLPAVNAAPERAAVRDEAPQAEALSCAS